MAVAKYSEELLAQIRNNTWQDPELDISFQNLDANAAKALASALATNTHIKILNISNNNIGDAGTIALAESNSLVSLKISSNNVGKAGATALAKNDSLTDLNLFNNNVGDAGAIALAKNDSLTDLNLFNNNVGDAGAIALAKNNSLFSLDIGSNSVDDAGITALAKNMSLISLNISFNRFSIKNKKGQQPNLGLQELQAEDERRITERLQKNRIMRENNLRLAPLLSFMRANHKNYFKDSIFSLIPTIAGFAGTNYSNEKHEQKLINFSNFLGSIFARSEATKSLPAEATPSQQAAVISSI